MQKIRYLKRTHDAYFGEVRCVPDNTAAALVLSGSAEYLSHIEKGAGIASAPVQPQRSSQCGTRSGEKKNHSSRRQGTGAGEDGFR